MTTTLDAGTILPAPPTMASPSWWGADSERHRVAPGPDGSRGTFVKVMRPATTAYVHLPTAFGAAVAAGRAGLGPEVLEASEPARTLVQEDLTGRAKTATLADFLDTGLVHRYLALRRDVRSLDVPGARRATVFDDVRSLTGLARAQGTVLPGDLPWMLRVLEDAELRIAATGYDTALCHGDGNVSNVLVDPPGRPLLVDCVSAAVMDPLQDLGVVLAELAPSDDYAR